MDRQLYPRACDSLPESEDQSGADHHLDMMDEYVCEECEDDSDEAENEMVESTPYNQRAHPVPWRRLWSPPESPERMSEAEIVMGLEFGLVKLRAGKGFYEQGTSERWFTGQNMET